jgi:dipeptidyl-peptidase-4
VKQITKGEFEVKDFLGWDQKANVFYYTSNEGSPLRTAVYKIDGKGKKTKLSTRTGTNSALFSKNLNYYINTYSSAQTPTLITLNNNKGQEMVTLLDNKKLKSKTAQLNMPTKEFFSFKTSEGVELNGWMMKPANFNPSKKYPVIMQPFSSTPSLVLKEKNSFVGMFS